MIRKKSSFLTFCFAFIPGAGQMYMGFMQRGVSLMAAFFLSIFFATWLSLSPLVFITVVLWFYAFFDTFNLRSMPDDEFYAMEDDYLVIPGLGKKTSQRLQKKYRTILAVVLIAFGLIILWNNLCDILRNILPEVAYDIIRNFGHYFPQMLIGFAIIVLGLYLIIGKKKELEDMDDFAKLEDKGGN